MPLNLIHGPPNSGRAGLVRRRFGAALDHDPVLVVPTIDDVYSFERELCEDGAVLGATVMTFGGLFGAVATAAGAPPGTELTPAQRLGAVSAAIAERRDALGPLRRSALRPGFALALERLLGELQEAGLEPADMAAGAGSLESSAYLGDIATLFAGYAEVRDRLGRVDTHGIARGAIRALRDSEGSWRQRPVFLYGLDDLTRNQLDLIGALAAATEVTVALPYEEGNTALMARSALLESLREIGVASETETEPNPANTDSPLLFHLERGFGAAEPGRRQPDPSLAILRSAGERGEAEAIGAEVAKLIASGADPTEIAVVLRDPARRGPLLASVLESYGVPTALEAKIAVGATAIGGGLIALLEATVGAGRAADLLRYLRAASRLPAGRIDSFERAVRRRRIQSAAAAVALWEERFGDPPRDLERVRKAAGEPRELAREVGRIAASMAARPLPGGTGEDGLLPAHCADLEQLSAAAISNALAERAELDGLVPAPAGLAAVLAEIEVRAWSGPVEGRVRIADPYRVRATRFDRVFVASLQDGEFPRRDGRADPFLSEQQRDSLGLPPRRDTEAEERYLFHACLALPRKQLFLSYRDSDENGTAEARSPLLDDVRRLLDPPPNGEAADSVEAALTQGRDLAQVVHRVAEAPSETELARAIAAHGPAADVSSLLARAGVGEEPAARVAERVATARGVEATTRAPGPLSNPAVIEALATVPAYGGTTLEGFDLCSYRWFVSHELDPRPLDPTPDTLVQGGLMHRVLDRLYRERPQGDPLPRPGSLGAWIGRGRELVGESAAELGGHPAERAIVRRVEGLLARFLAEEAHREPGGFEPWLLEAGFGEAEETERPVLEIDGWGLHGAIDRVDRAPDGRALVLDYKLSGRVTPRERLEQEAKLQLQLYMIAVAEHWGSEAIGGLYHPLRGTSERRPRGAVLDEAAGQLASYRLSRTDLVDAEGLEEMLADARRRAGVIVARMRRGEIRRDPGPRRGLRGHGICPPFCDFAPICRRDRAPVEASGENGEER
ncbi:MAG TPA: PD-(D/E)XK nuclease family protein [Solirubrobacterales bacterium]|nr:PD-(D/E)XK nuclease family protein [Solirubrobacterales bacterium]